MIKEFTPIIDEIPMLLEQYLSKLKDLDVERNSIRRNSQNRSVRQILGHMIDSASNNTHRIIHLQYRKGPVEFPNYATLGNNDRWIAIQNYQEEDWHNLLNLWKYSNLHIVHVIRNITESSLANEWIDEEGLIVNLKEMAIDFLPHFKLHLEEIDQLIA